MSRRLCNLQNLFVKLRARYGDGDNLVEEIRRELQCCQERESQLQALLEIQQPLPPVIGRTRASDGRSRLLL
jgi:hypothetical protein